MKIYISNELGGIFQLSEGELWAYPLSAKSEVIDLDTDKDMEWACVDGYGDPVEYEGKEIPQLEFAQIIRAKLS